MVPASLDHPERWDNWKWVCLVGVVAAILYLKKRYRSRSSADASKKDGKTPNSHELTEQFTSSIPELTRELNLEVATAEVMETFDRSESKSIFWGFLSLGTNGGSIMVPVTYRYHLRLLDSWYLEIQGDILIVRAPEIRASVPPAFNSQKMRTSLTRGWLRLPPDDLLAGLHRDLTPTLTRLASDPRRINLIRETCRQSVAEFVGRWLNGQSPGMPLVKHIQVQFPGENPTLNVTGPARFLK
jgi:hypothetical protein